MCGNLSGFMPAGIGIFGAVLGVTVGAFITYRFGAIREFASACGELHAAFAMVKLYLEHGLPAKPPQMVINSIPAHEAAIARFRFQLSKDRRLTFDTACKEYRNRRGAIEAQETAGGTATDAKTELLKTINQLLSYTDERPGFWPFAM